MKLAAEILHDARRDSENLKRTLQEMNQQSLARAWGVLGLLTEFLPTFLNSTETLHRTSVFWIYYDHSVHLARRAWTEALCLYYGPGHSMLRNALESLIRGAFWEGMAHRKFRADAQVVRRTGGKIGMETKTLLDWFADVFKHDPNAEDELEQKSGAVFDKTSALFAERRIGRYLAVALSQGKSHCRP